MKRTSPSRFPWGKWLLVLGLLLVLNSAYVAAFSTPDLFYITNDLLHPFLGLLVAILLVVFAIRHRGFFSGEAAGISLVLLAAAAGFGVYLAIVGMTRPHTEALYLHVGSAIAGLFFLLVHLRTRMIGNRRSKIEDRSSKFQEQESAGMPDGTDQSSQTVEPRFSSFEFRISVFVMLGSLAFYLVAIGYQRWFPNPRYIILNP